MHLSIPDNSGAAFTLVELVISTALAAIVICASVYGYVHSARRAEWSAHSLAAHSIAMQKIEQMRAAKWDPNGWPPVDELTNPPARVDILDIPISGTNIAYATSVTTVTTVSATPPLKKIRVDTAWQFAGGGVFTNTILTYRGPDQ